MSPGSDILAAGRFAAWDIRLCQAGAARYRRVRKEAVKETVPRLAGSGYVAASGAAYPGMRHRACDGSRKRGLA